MLVAAEGMSEALDAVADALTAEAVYQIVKGNPENALATLERIAKGEEPPALTVTQSPTPGVRLTHRVAVVLPANATAPGWPVVRTPRAAAEPLLDAWCGLMLGPADAVTLTVDHDGGALPVPLPSLGIAAIDVVMAGRDGGRELGERAVRAARAGQPGLVDPRVRADRPFKDLVGLCNALAAVITHGSPLSADAFEVPSALPSAPDEQAGDLPARVLEAEAVLTALRDALVAGHDLQNVATRAADFGIRVPDLTLLGAITDDQRTALRASVETRLAAAASGTPRDRLRALFGGELPGVVTVHAARPDDADDGRRHAAREPVRERSPGAGRPGSMRWAARTRTSRASPRSSCAGKRRAGRSNRCASHRRRSRPATSGSPRRSPAPAVARRSAGCRSSCTRRSAWRRRRALGGLLIDAWTETVPAKVRDTAMALHFNNASTRAPQVVLLGVSPDPSKRLDRRHAGRGAARHAHVHENPDAALDHAQPARAICRSSTWASGPGTSRISFSVEG